MKYNDNDNARNGMRRYRLESKRVNDSAVTATVTMIMSALCYNNIQVWLQNIKRCKSNRAISTRYILSNTNVDGIVTFKPYISESTDRKNILL